MGKGGVVEGGGLQLRAQVPGDYFHAVEISFCTIYLLWLSRKHTQTHHGHSHVLFHAKAAIHTHKHIQTHTHTLKQASVMKTVSSNLQELLCAADGVARGYLPRSVEDQKNIQIQGGTGTR